MKFNTDSNYVIDGESLQKLWDAGMERLLTHAEQLTLPSPAANGKGEFMDKFTVNNDRDLFLDLIDCNTPKPVLQLQLKSGSTYLQYDEVAVMRNWLSDWLGTHRPETK